MIIVDYYNLIFIIIKAKESHITIIIINSTMYYLNNLMDPVVI